MLSLSDVGLAYNISKQDTQFKAMLDYATNATSGNTVASSWAQSLDMASLPDWSHSFIAENVLYTQTFLAANPDAIKSDGSIDASLGGNPPVIPEDITKVAAAASPSGSVSGSPASSSSAADPSGSSSPVGAMTQSGNGASAVSRSGVSLSLAVLAVGLFLL